MIHLVKPPFGLAFYFDGNDYIEISSSLLDFSKYSAYTIVAWVMRTSTGAGGFIGYQPPSGTAYRSPSMWFYPSENDFHFGHGDGSAWRSTVVSGILGMNKWFMLAIRWSISTGVIEGFVNGSKVGEVSAPNPPASNTTYHIGRVDSYHKGLIPEARVYNRFLSDTELADLYNIRRDIKDGLILKLSTYGLVRGGGSKWLDESGNSLHGTVNGAIRVRCCHCNPIMKFGTATPI